MQITCFKLYSSIVPVLATLIYQRVTLLDINVEKSNAVQASVATKDAICTNACSKIKQKTPFILNGANKIYLNLFIWCCCRQCWSGVVCW